MPRVIAVALPEELLDLLEDMAMQSIEELKAEDDAQYDGWYCINIKPQKCVGCGSTMCYMEPPLFHLIVVWENKDDEEILKCAEGLKNMKLEPRIETYHPILGHCIPWSEVEEMLEELADD